MTMGEREGNMVYRRQSMYGAEWPCPQAPPNFWVVPRDEAIGVQSLGLRLRQWPFRYHNARLVTHGFNKAIINVA